MSENCDSLRTSCIPSSGLVIWIFGRPSSGKTTLALNLLERLTKNGSQLIVLDGDEVRKGLCKDLGYSVADRTENIRRVAEVANLVARFGNVVVVACITPLVHQRSLVALLLGDVRVHFVYLPVSAETCVARDAKGLYAQALRGEVNDMTGISSKFEPIDPGLEAEFIVAPNEGPLEIAEFVIQRIGLKL